MARAWTQSHLLPWSITNRLCTMRVLIPFLLTTSIFAAERKLPPGLEPVAQLALSAPPEFAADGLLRLVESKKIIDQPTEIELTQQAFDLASSAHFRAGMRPIPGTAPDTRAGSLGKAYRLKITLSEAQQGIALQNDATITRYNNTLDAHYTLSDARGDVLTTGEQKELSAYNVVQSPYATLAAEQDSSKRAAQDVAERIHLDLGVWFRQHKK